MIGITALTDQLDRDSTSEISYRNGGGLRGGNDQFEAIPP
jgi:hypothetical protein